MRLAAFAGLTALAAWRYAGVETQPPTVRVLVIVAIAVLAGAAMMLIPVSAQASRRARVRAAGARLMVAAVLTSAALVAAGVPHALLLPTAWDRLGTGLHKGLATVATTLWPYQGTDSWTRLDILLPLALIPLAAAALAFWPTGGRPATSVVFGIRRVCALALLLVLYVMGVIDSNGGSVTVEGLLLLALVVAWLWLPGLRGRRVLAALVWLGAAGLLAAILVTDVPGSQSWFNYRAWDLFGSGQTSTAFAWDQTYGPIPWSRSERTMFTVRSPAPLMWKVTTLDRFDGLRFVRSGTDPSNEADLPLPLNGRWYGFATFAIQGLRSALLPTDQGTTEAVNFHDPIQYEPDGTVQELGKGLRSGDAYTVMSYVPRPSPAELREAPRSFPASYLRYTDFDLPSPTQSGLHLAATDPLRPGQFITRRTVGAPAPAESPAAISRIRRAIVASPYGPMYRLARRLASGTRSTYDVVLAIENYLIANYAYSEQSPERRYPLESFLFEDRIGYCQQFSGAMALMLRMDGIPARVAAGFLPGAYDSATRSYRVSALDAHAWVEVYFTGIGWVPFNPTPPRSVAPPQRPLFTSQSTVNSLQAIAATVGGPPPVARTQRPAGGHRATSGLLDARVALLAIAAVAVLALLMLAARCLVGHGRLRRSLHGDAELATLELVSALPRLGFVLPARVTLAQVEEIVRIHGGPDAARYVRRLRDRRYAPGGATSLSLRDRRLLRARLTAPLGLDARLRGLWALPPSTLGWRLGDHAAGDSAGGP
ncbi:MAG: transglutaminase domain-containing protein [Solirubrobacterales bacterium]|nr:transglutaminase domain-containing protein [Solirubrobacterales bacterium]